MRTHAATVTPNPTRPQRAFAVRPRAPGLPASPRSAIARLQASAGNHAIAQLMSRHPIAPVDTPAERQATAFSTAAGRPAGANRAAADTGASAIPASHGRPLEPALRAELEPAFRQTLATVQIHDDPTAHRAAHDARAHAFTHGEHIVLDASLRELLHRAGGRKLLAHELAHVLQQRGGGQREPSPAPASPIETEADAAATAVTSGRAAPPLTGTAVGLARVPKVPRNVTELSPWDLEAEYLATQKWLIKNHPNDPGYQLTRNYFQRLEEEFTARMTSAPTAPTVSQPLNYKALGDEELAALSRQADTDAAAELFDRARSRAGYQAPEPGYEELGPETNPEFIGPESPPYGPQTQLRQGDIEDYMYFNTKARARDKLFGHETRQHARLKAIGLATRRGKGEASRRNPSMAVSKPLHGLIGAAQKRKGLHDKSKLAAMSDEEVIAKNAECLEEAGVERSQIEMNRREALRHAARLPKPTSSGRTTPPKQTLTQPSPETTTAEFTPVGEAAGAKLAAPVTEAPAVSDPTFIPPVPKQSVAPTTAPKPPGGSGPGAAVVPEATAQPPAPTTAEPQMSPAPTAQPPAPAAKPPAALAPAPPTAAPIEHAAPGPAQAQKPSASSKAPGGGSGAGGALLGVGFNIAAAVAHAGAVAQIRQQEGYAPVGGLAYAHESLPLRMGRIFSGSAIETQEDLRTRFHVAAWRQFVRARARAVPVGGTLKIVYQAPTSDALGTQFVHDLPVAYRRNTADRWSVVSERTTRTWGQAIKEFFVGSSEALRVLKGLAYPTPRGVWRPPDLNVIIGPAPDRDVETELRLETPDIVRERSRSPLPADLFA